MIKVPTGSVPGEELIFSPIYLLALTFKNVFIGM